MNLKSRLIRAILIAVGGFLLLTLVGRFLQGKLLYFPTHNDPAGSALSPWMQDNRTIGYCRKPGSATARIWLMLHGNAGQASYRDYVLDCIAEDEGLFVVEYPGYGVMTGRPSAPSLNETARNAYQTLRRQYPGHPIWVLGESLGAGPASLLAKEPDSPAGITLVVPFCRLRDVAIEKFGRILVAAFMSDDWDNAKILAGYKGIVTIYGATQDMVIPFHHARRLADQVPGSIFREIQCGHNDWANPWYVDLKRDGKREQEEAG